MKITVEHHFADYRGDHSAAAIVAHGPGAHETVLNLAKRLLGSRDKHHDGTDFIVIRKIHPPEPPKPDPAE